MTSRKTKEEFLTDAKKVHGDKYDYSKVDFEHKDENGRVCIICPKHGEFFQRPIDHLDGHGCRKCGFESSKKIRAKSQEEFKRNIDKIFFNYYDLSKVEYVNNSTEVTIICPIHGEFKKKPQHLLRGQGCKHCRNIPKTSLPKVNKPFRKKCTTEEFIEKAKKIHGDKYDYSKVEYINNKTEVTLICPIHGEFKIRPNSHLSGQGCPKCGIIRNGFSKRIGKDEFIKRAREIHGKKYDYSKVEYVNNNTKVCIICPKHGEFWQTPYNHLNGNGCKFCKGSLLENNISEALNEMKIEYEYNTRPKFLNGLELDFYLPKYNAAIECQGTQHFLKHHFFEPLHVIQERDKLKKQLCEENGIKLLYYSNLGIDYPYHVYENKKELIGEIING